VSKLVRRQRRRFEAPAHMLKGRRQNEFELLFNW
jgi:hypothetical protein